MLTDFLMIATVVRPQGVRGECKLRSWASNINLFNEWHTLYQKTATGFNPVSVRVARIRDGFVYAFLNESTNANEAEAFRGTDLYVDRAHAAPAEDNAVLIADLIGCEAKDENGVIIGTLTDVLQFGTVDTWVFKTSEGTLMVPALISVFPEVNAEEKTISAIRGRLEEVSVLS